MTGSELRRKLLFYGYTEVTDYLKSSPLNRFVYKKFLTLLPEYGIDVPLVTMFNEIYYQCVRVNYDGTPGVDIERRYIAEAEEWLQSREAADIVFGVVWAVLKSKRKQTIYEDYFLYQLTFYVENSELREVIKSIHTEISYLDIEVPDSFPTLTCPIDEIPKFVAVKFRNRRWLWKAMFNASVEGRFRACSLFLEYKEHTEAWKTVTSNYSHSVIENYVRLYSRTDDQLGLIERIQKTLPKGEVSKQEKYFQDLVSRIKTGNFDPEDDFTGKRVPKACQEPDGDLHRNVASYRVFYKKEIDVIGDLKEERDRLKAQVTDMQKSHEMELARMEAKYKAEIERFLRERNNPAHAPVARKEPVLKPKEFMLSLSEIADFVKERFSKTAANEICTMLYGMVSEHGFFGEETFKLIDGIIPAVIKRDKPQQNIEISTAQQVNLQPKEVNNIFKKKNSL